MGYTVQRCRIWRCVGPGGACLHVSRSPRALRIGHAMCDAVACVSGFDGYGKCKRNSSGGWVTEVNANSLVPAIIAGYRCRSSTVAGAILV